MNRPKLVELELAMLKEHPKNPRTQFDGDELASLAASIGVHGVLVPLKVSPVDGGYVICAGHRRARAATIAGLHQVPCIVEELTEDQIEALLYVENLQRADIHPLDEGQGYADWMKAKGLSVAQVAKLTGKTERYVFDTLKLLNLGPEARKLWREGILTRPVAVILARLTRADQKRCIEDTRDGALELEGGALGSLFGTGQQSYKCRTPREVQQWVDKFVRFDATSDVSAFLFPETAAVVEAAAKDAAKILGVTFLHQCPPSAKADGERTYTNPTWRRADGKPDLYRGEKKTKRCDHAQPAIVVAGPYRGDAMLVCVEKKKCQVHWAKKVETAPAKKSDDKLAGAREAWIEKQREFRQAEDAWREETRKIATKAQKQLLKAIIEWAGSLTTIERTALQKGVKDRLRVNAPWAKPSTIEIVGRMYLLSMMVDRLDNWRIGVGVDEVSKMTGLDLVAVIEAASKKKWPKRPAPPTMPVELQEEIEQCDTCGRALENCECEEQEVFCDSCGMPVDQCDCQLGEAADDGEEADE